VPCQPTGWSSFSQPDISISAIEPFSCAAVPAQGKLVGVSRPSPSFPASPRRLFELLRYLSRVGDAAAKVRPELALRFKLPALNTPIPTFVHAVRAMIGVAEAEREVLAGVGLSEAALAALKREVAELEQTIKTSGTARAEHVGASSSLADVTREVLNLVGMLDGLNRYRYRGNPELLAEWELATHVRAAPRRHLADEEGEDSGAGGSSEGGRGASAA
jgi:hypothetical protein